MSTLDHWKIWWREWDAGPLIRLVLWSILAAAFAWHRWHLTPTDLLYSGAGLCFRTILISGFLFQLLAVGGGLLVRAFFVADDLLYRFGDILGQTIWPNAPRLTRLSIAIAIELSLIWIAAIMIVGWSGKSL